MAEQRPMQWPPAIVSAEEEDPHDSSKDEESPLKYGDPEEPEMPIRSTQTIWMKKMKSGSIKICVLV